MSVSSHTEYTIEQRHLERTAAALKARIEQLGHTDVTTAHPTAQGAVYDQLRREYEDLLMVTDTPYFARIDFVDRKSEEPETHYLGKKGFESDGVMVVDWRAPLATLYYRGRPGTSRFDSPAGPIFGSLLLKRNFDIRAWQLLDIIDQFDLRPKASAPTVATADVPVAVSVAVSDEYIRRQLAGKKGVYLHDIVSTIQEQQYDVIQADPNQVLIIQGVAGSGKTVIALHRLAYLLYPGNVENLRADRCIVFGPNRLFLNYISKVLPDLTVGGITQTTLADWACEQLGFNSPRLTDVVLGVVLSQETTREDKIEHYRRSQIKNSLRMVQILERLVERRRQLTLPDAGLSFSGLGPLRVTVMLNRDQILEIHGQRASLPLKQHREQFLNALRARVEAEYEQGALVKIAELAAGGKQLRSEIEQLRAGTEQLDRWLQTARAIEDDDFNAETVGQAIEEGEAGLAALIAYYEKQLAAILNRAARSKSDIGEIEEKQKLARQLTEQIATEIDKAWPKFDAVADYFDVMTSQAALTALGKDILKTDEIQLLSRTSRPAKQSIDLSDLPALHYLALLAEGVMPRYDHIVIDEAQDVSPLQLAALQKFSRSGAFTLLGDLPQSIHSYRGLASWKDIQAAMPGQSINLQQITKSYRATYEITTFANSVLQSLARIRGQAATKLAEPFDRHGEQPQLHEVTAATQLSTEIQQVIEQARQKGYESIAIIGRTVQQCRDLASGLKQLTENVALVDTPDFKYQGGLILIPVNLAKGMEFEVSLVVEADEQAYSATEYDGRLLYVALTRASHELHVFWRGRITPHLETWLAKDDSAIPF
jgi:DNA helicase II / ATP-dependent DNA helicase PcrA